ncbi:MAG TPA: PucR family transcriptional regulator ligand-binding domain-containing protein [Streptosporangiaceae bacterium]|nr:PucR family transcriptional regulator ligand-binding domain-containing protein [Streptosporangiaceae bacterium]
MLPTVAEVLALDPVRRGAPRLVAAADRLDSPVRWVHVIELAQAAHLLRGGELVLSTGIALPHDDAGLARYVADLASVGISALAVELGSRYARSLPQALVAAAGAHRLPLVMFERETQFIEITEAVHGLIIDSQVAELRAAERLHQVFTELAVSGAPADEVVSQAATLAGCPVILENLSHQVLACATGPQDAAGLLAGFATRSRGVTAPGRTGYDATSGWLVTVVGARGQDWGRLIMVRGAPPAPRDLALLERAATTLALGRLLDHQRESLERQAHRTILAAFLGHGYGDPAEAQARARALGVPVTGRRLLAAVIRTAEAGGAGDPELAAPARSASVADAVAEACRQQRVPALVAALDDSRVAALLSLPARADADAVLAALAGVLRPRLRPGEVIGAGSVVESVTGVQRTFLEADQVAAVAARAPGGRAFYRLPDLRLRGLVHLLRDDPRMQAFAERELGPLLLHDAGGGQLVAALTAYLEAGGNKAEAAKRAHLARPTLYERLRQIEAVLGTSLEPPESRLSLHVALLAHRAISSSAGLPPEGGYGPGGGSG